MNLHRAIRGTETVGGNIGVCFPFRVNDLGTDESSGMLLFDCYHEASSILLGACVQRNICLGMTVIFMPQALI